MRVRQVQGTVPRFQESFIGEGSYSPAGVLRQLLAVGFDGFLLDDHVPHMTGDTPYGHRAQAHGIGYMLDGQTATVDDYLEVRPEGEAQLAALVARGQLSIGPWHILMDEFLVSGETIVRNLELGIGRATRLGGVMRAGYLPDMFGHIAQMPQILARAGIDDAVVWRGVPWAIDVHAFTWRSPDGSAVRCEYLCRGYGNARELLDRPEAIAAGLDAYRNLVGDSFGSDHLLAMYGEDHSIPGARYAPESLLSGAGTRHRGPGA